MHTGARFRSDHYKEKSADPAHQHDHSYTWMMLLLSDILPSDHNSDLPLSKCQLVYAIMT